MATPDHDREIDPLSIPVSPGAVKTPARRGRRTRRPGEFAARFRLRPRVGLLEGRVLLSALPTVTALRASAASALTGQSITFTATVSDPIDGGDIPNGGTVTFRDQGGAIGTATLVNGVAEFTTSSLAAGTVTVSASYSGTTNFAASATGTIVTVAGTGPAGYTGDNGPAIDAELNNPRAAVDSAGDLFLGDGSNVVREVVKATGVIITVAGTGIAGYSGDNGPATAAKIDGPNSVAVDSAGNLFISDSGNNRIREVVKATGVIITVAGNGIAGYSGDNGPGTAAEIDVPRGISVNSAGNVFIADSANNRIREVVKATGVIITVAGDGTAGYSGDGGLATAAELNAPYFAAVNSAGDLFIGDTGNNRVREVVKATGKIITVAGNGTAGYTGDNGPATAAELYGVNGIAVDSVGDLFISDTGNNRIREVVKATGKIITVAGDGTSGYSGDNGPATSAELYGPGRVVIDSAGDLFISVVYATNVYNVIREVTPAVTVTIEPSSGLGTVTSLRVSTVSAAIGESISFIVTVTNLSSIGGIPNGGTVTFSDQFGVIGTATLIDGVAEFTTSSLAAGTITVSASYGGTINFAASATGTIEAYAGNGTAGYTGNNGIATSAELNAPWGVALDSSGDLFIADGNNNTVREVVKATGIITTIAGNGTAGYKGNGGAATSAELNFPDGLAIDAAGDVFISDRNNNVIREVVKATGIITTIAGTGSAGDTGNGGLATAAKVNSPRGIAIDSEGDVFLADFIDNVVREVVASTGEIIIVAGTGTAGYTGNGGLATAARLDLPEAVAVDSAGNLYISDNGNSVVREVSKATGVILTIAGDGTAGSAGNNGPATSAELHDNQGLAVDPEGDVFIADNINEEIREVVKASGDIIDVAGNGVEGYAGNGGPAISADLHFPGRVAIDAAGDLFIADSANNEIREVTPGVTLTIGPSSALNTVTSVRVLTSESGLGESITFIATITDLSAGGGVVNGGTIVFSDQNGVIGTSTVVNGIATLIISDLGVGSFTITVTYDGTTSYASSGTGTIITAVGIGAAGYEGDGGPGSAAELDEPFGVAVDSAGDLFIADFLNNVVREVVKATGDIITVAGNGIAGYSGDGGPATAAELNGPIGITVDAAGDLFIAELNNNVIREVIKATGVIITVAGNGTAGYSGDGGLATLAELDEPRDVAVDAAGNLFFTDYLNHRIREVVKATGIITTVAGNGIAGYSGDNGLATAAELNYPVGLALDPAGDLYIADFDNNVIREVMKATGIITTVVGDGAEGYSGDGGPATAAELNGPGGVVLDPAGDLFIADENNDVIREVVKATGDIITYAGDGTAGYSGDGGPATSAELDGPVRLAIDSAGDLFVGDGFNNVIREVTQGVTVTISQIPVPTIVWPALSAIIYGTALSGTQLDATAIDNGSTVAGTFVYSFGVGSILEAGTQTLFVTFIPNNTAAYQSVSAETTLVVDPSMPTINWPAPAAIVYGTALSAIQLDATANVPGTFSYSPAAGTVPGGFVRGPHRHFHPHRLDRLLDRDRLDDDQRPDPDYDLVVDLLGRGDLASVGDALGAGLGPRRLRHPRRVGHVLRRDHPDRLGAAECLGAGHDRRQTVGARPALADGALLGQLERLGDDLHGGDGPRRRRGVGRLRRRRQDRPRDVRSNDLNLLHPLFRRRLPHPAAWQPRRREHPGPRRFRRRRQDRRRRLRPDRGALPRAGVGRWGDRPPARQSRRQEHPDRGGLRRRRQDGSSGVRPDRLPLPRARVGRWGDRPPARQQHARQPAGGRGFRWRWQDRPRRLRSDLVGLPRAGVGRWRDRPATRQYYPCQRPDRGGLRRRWQDGSGGVRPDLGRLPRAGVGRRCDRQATR